MKTLSSESEKKFSSLKKYLSNLKSAAIAYSGGVDSTLLLYSASIIPGLKIVAYTIKNSMIPEAEIISAVKTAEKYNIKHEVIDLDILSFKSITANSPDRCYHCKTLILTTIITAAADHGIELIIEGSHTGDISDYRPGLKAIRELGVLSPLKEAGFDKKGIYELSSYLDLPTSEKESYPCLATRIPYGTPLTSSLLRKAEIAEKILSSFGFKQVRARIHGDVLRIEVTDIMIPALAASPLREKIYAALHEAGFIYITLDLLGYRTGSMNLNFEENK